jgi:hypothetical protein
MAETKSNQPTSTLGSENRHIADVLPADVIKKQLLAMEAANKPLEDSFDALIQSKEAKDTRDAMGMDIEFDIDSLILQGSIERKGIFLAKGFPYFDMHTLTKEEDMLAEEFVQEIIGNTIKVDKVYYEKKEVAVLAMAITRMNNARFPKPDKRSMDEKLYNYCIEKKKLLMSTLTVSQNNTVSALSLIYSNLALADVLSDEAKKKSEELLDQENSGQSVTNSDVSQQTQESIS